MSMIASAALRGLIVSALLAAAVPAAAEGPSDPATAPEIRAQLSPRRSAVLSSEIPGKIANVSVREGDRFTEKQTLVAFDCALNRAKLAKAQAAAEKARRTHTVNAKLDKLNSISTLEVESAVADLAQAEAEVAMSRILVDRCMVEAPFAGRVAALDIKRWQYIGEGQPLMEILDDRDLELEMIVPARWLTWLKTGVAFEVAIDETGKTYRAEITRLAARIDPVSQSIKVFAKIHGQHDELLSGMSGRALIGGPS